MSPKQQASGTVHAVPDTTDPARIKAVTTIAGGEEVGELFKAVRKAEKIKIDHNSKITSVSEELADVLIFLCSIANKFEIDLEKAFREKEEINKTRSWK